MKLTRRIFALALCLMMVFGMTATAFAATSYTLTINNTSNDHTYEAYQIFSGELATVDGKQILSTIKWGSAIVKEGAYDHSAELLADINAEPKLAILHGATSAGDLGEKIANNITSDSESLDLLAEIFGDLIREKGVDYAGVSTDKGDHYEIGGLSAGYYLVKDKDGTLTGDTDEYYTKYIIRVLKDESVTPKGEAPSVEKSINDTLGGTYTEYEDFDINDTAYYKWEGKLPSNLTSYDAYYYKFIDTLPTGIQFLQFEQIYIEGHDGNLVHTFYDITDSDPSNNTMPAGITPSTSGNPITLEFNDLFTLYPNILATHKVIVKYTARVTRDALIKQAMTNSVKVEYSNNPNGEGTGFTTPDVAHAFTFKLTVDKYDADDNTKKLENAKFVLYYERTENVGGTDTLVKYYAQVITEEMIADGEIINGTVVDIDDLGVVYGWIKDKTQASVLDTDSNGALSVRGLDEGIYYLEETEAPAGYNLMETPVQIKIIPTYTVGEASATVAVSYEVDSIAQESETVGVRNSSGSTLPVTGGIGTTMFYLFGSIMVLGAVVLLVTKKRMSAEM